MLDGLTPDLVPRLWIAIGGVAVAFLVLIAVLVFLKRRNSPLFIKGGRVREQRLLVLDAAAVDAKRRLVLIRRDDTEHLIMIGGPTDIVIETGINGDNRHSPGIAAPVAPQPAVVVQRPAVADRPAAALPVRPAEVAVVSRPNAGRPNRQEQNGDPGQNVRRLERQAARAAEAVKAKPSDAAAISAMGSVLYGGDRESKAEEKIEAQPDAIAANSRVETPQRPQSAAAQAENVLDLARSRVLAQAVAVQNPGTTRNDDAIRALEEQLDASKAEAARAEAARAEAAQQREAERMAAAKADAERAETVRAEAARLEAVRLEAQKAESARREAERAAQARVEAERVEASRAEAARIEAEKAEVARAEAARIESERIAVARAEAMARFEAARRAQAEQRQTQQPVAQQAVVERQPVVRQEQWVVADPYADETVAAEPQPWPLVEQRLAEPATARREDETAELEDATNKSQQRLASDFEKLLEAELEADGVFDRYAAPPVAGERRDSLTGAPAINPGQREVQPITGATPGASIEQDMARRLGEISLNRKTDSL